MCASFLEKTSLPESLLVLQKSPIFPHESPITPLKAVFLRKRALAMREHVHKRALFFRRKTL